MQLQQNATLNPARRSALVTRRAPMERRQAQRKVWANGETQLEYRMQNSDTLSGLLFAASKPGAARTKTKLS